MEVENNIFYYDNETIVYPCTEEGLKQVIEDQIMWITNLRKNFDTIKKELLESIDNSLESIRGKFICLDPFQYNVYHSFTFLVCDTQEELEEAYEQSAGDV